MQSAYKLPYNIDALDPHISQEVLSDHYKLHYSKYVNTTKELIKGTFFEQQDIEEIAQSSWLKLHSKLSNNVLQVLNHEQYFDTMTPGGSVLSAGSSLTAQIEADFDAVSNLIAEATNAFTNHFSNSWGWVVFRDGKLQVETTSNADRPSSGAIILVCDLWEHSHQKQYPADRKKYIEQWWRVVDWKRAEDRFVTATHSKG